jgi:hypothetical protein
MRSLREERVKSLRKELEVLVLDMEVSYYSKREEIGRLKD